MRQTRVIMGMPITIETTCDVSESLFNHVFDYFNTVDQRFSTYKPDSEVCACNRGEITAVDFSAEMRDVLAIAEETKAESHGYFEVRRADGSIDPSGIVKGWAIGKAAEMMLAQGVSDFYIDAGGDVAAHGVNEDGECWRAGIRNPFNSSEIVKAVRLKNCGIATSGTYVRGQHIYDPHKPDKKLSDIVSLTVIGADILEADRFATAAFAMGEQGIYFIEERAGLEGYAINANGIATQTSGFGDYVIS